MIVVLVDLEGIAIYMTVVILVAVYLVLMNDELFSSLSKWLPYLVLGSVVDLVLHIFRTTYFYLPQFWAQIDFLNYYAFTALLAFMIWNDSEKLQDIENERNHLVLIINYGLFLVIALLYSVTSVWEFFEASIVFYAFHGFFATLFLAINAHRLHKLKGGAVWLLIMYSSVLWCLGCFLYPSFLFSAIIFYMALVLFYLGMFSTLISLLLFEVLR